MEHAQLIHYSRHVYYDSDAREYVALCTEFPHLSAFGATAADALAELEVALEGAIEVHVDEGWPLPAPVEPPEPVGLPSGRFVARLPRSLHAQLVASAQREGVSLNALVVSLLSAGVAGGANAAAQRGAISEVVEEIREMLRPAIEPPTDVARRTTVAVVSRSSRRRPSWTVVGPDPELDADEWYGDTSSMSPVQRQTARIEG
jgi:antitoxin HicB